MPAKQRYSVIISPDITTTKDESIKYTPKFKALIRDKTIQSQRLTLTALKNKILDGYSINLGIPENKSLIALDIDNKGSSKLTLDMIMTCLNRIKASPVFIFETSKSSQECLKMRIIIALDKPVTSKTVYEEILKSLVDYLNLFCPESTDQSTCMCSSIFYPCKSLIYENLAAIGSLDEVMALSALIRPTSIIPVDYQNFITDVLVKYGLDKSELEKHTNPDCYIHVFNARSGASSLYNYGVLKKNLSSEAIKYRYLLRWDTQEFLLSQESLTSLYKPVFNTPIMVKDFLYNQIEMGVLGIFFRFLTENSKSVFSDNNDLIGKILTSDSGKENYCVFSKNKNNFHVRTYSVLDILMKLTNSKTTGKALNNLYKICNIKADIPRNNIVRKNITDYKNSIELYLKEYKYLYSLLSYKDNNFTKYILYTVLDLAQERYLSIFEEKGNIIQPDIQIFLSRNYIQKIVEQRYLKKSSISTIGCKINLLTFLELLTKVPDNKLNELTVKIIESSGLRKGKEHLVITIPHYTKNLLKQANFKAKEFIESNMSVEGMRQDKNSILKLVKTSIYFPILDNYIKTRISNGDNFIVQTDLVHFLRESHPELTPSRLTKIVARYKDDLAINNNLKTAILTQLLAKKYKITKEQIKDNKYSLNRTNILFKEG